MVKSNSMPPARRSPKMLGPPKLTMDDLLKKTLLNRREASRNVAIKTLRKIKSPKGLEDWTTIFAETYSKDTKQRYVCHVFTPAEVAAGSSKVVGNCSCPDYTFTYEVANAKKGAAFIYRSNGEDPGVRNPKMAVGLCKHLYLVMRNLSKNRGEV